MDLRIVDTQTETTPPAGLVYAIGGEHGPVKIGWTKRKVESRLMDLQVATPTQLHVLATREGIQANETALHQRLSDFRIRGEWFEREPALAAFNISEPKHDALPDQMLDDLRFKYQRLRAEHETALVALATAQRCADDGLREIEYIRELYCQQRDRALELQYDLEIARFMLDNPTWGRKIA